MSTEAETTVTEGEKKQWGEDFDSMADVDGYISKDDLESYWQRNNKNPTKQDLDDNIAAAGVANTEGDCKITREDFLKIQSCASKAPFFSADLNTELVDALKVYDTNGDGTIDQVELKQVLETYADEDLEAVIKAADTDGNGKLSINELAAFMTKTFDL